MAEQDFSGEFRSPGGFVFGVQGWNWGEQRVTSITFFLDGTAMVCDQHGRPIKGTVVDNKVLKFVTTSPEIQGGDTAARAKCARHAEVVAALAVERIDWQTLVCAGWPQLPYAQLKALKELPPTPLEELRKIKDSLLRKDALRIRREVDEAREKELQAVEDE